MKPLGLLLKICVATALIISLTGCANTAATDLMSIGVKHSVKYALTPMIGEELAHDTIETSGMTFVGWNTALLLGASNPDRTSVAIISGWLYWEYTNR